MTFKPGMKPLLDDVMVSPVEVDKKTDGGIIIPDKHVDEKQLATTRGIIVATGPTFYDYDGYPEDEKPKAGDEVIYIRYSGQMITGDDGKEYRIIGEKDLRAIVSKA